MSDPILTNVEEAAAGVILRSPKVRGYVAAGSAILGLLLGGLHTWFNGHDPAWLAQSLVVYTTILAPASLGIWKANIPQSSSKKTAAPIAVAPRLVAGPTFTSVVPAPQVPTVPPASSRTGIMPVDYVPAPAPPDPVKNSGIGIPDTQSPAPAP